MNKNILFFALGAFFTFSFITLIQLVNPPLFFVFLVLMHVGIFFFILSRRGFKKQGIDVSKFFKIQYILLVPYLLVMVYKILTSVGVPPMFEEVKMVATLILTAIAIVISVINIMGLIKANREYQC